MRSWCGSSAVPSIAPTPCSVRAGTPIRAVGVVRRSWGSSSPAPSPSSAPRVTSWKVGDSVMGIEAGACNAELVTTHERQALPVPSNVALADAAAIPEVYLTALGRARRPGRPDQRALGAGACRRVGRRDGGDPDRQGDRGAHRRHVLGREGRRLSRARRRPRARTIAGGLGGGAQGRRARRRRHGARRGRRRRGQPQPRRGATAGNDRPGRADGRRPDACQPRTVARQARALDRHGAEDAPDRAEDRARAAVPARGHPVVRVGCVASGDRLALRARRHRRGPSPAWTPTPTSARSCSRSDVRRIREDRVSRWTLRCLCYGESRSEGRQPERP